MNNLTFFGMKKNMSLFVHQSEGNVGNYQFTSNENTCKLSNRFNEAEATKNHPIGCNDAIEFFCVPMLIDPLIA